MRIEMMVFEDDLASEDAILEVGPIHRKEPLVATFGWLTSERVIERGSRWSRLYLGFFFGQERFCTISLWKRCPLADRGGANEVGSRSSRMAFPALTKWNGLLVPFVDARDLLGMALLAATVRQIQG